MKKWLTLPLALFCALAGAQTTVTPILQPHQTFVDGSGSPCALCKLSSYVAGTTTPQPTWTDSTGGTQNTNPIVLDVSGGANIWLGTSLSYKFVLKDALGNTIWTVDNVAGAKGLVPCPSNQAIQFANTSTSTLNCDPNITIDPASHALQVGGAISGPAFSLKNLAAITSGWTLDVTSPTTALNSFGAIPLSNLVTQAADSVLGNFTGSSATPTAVVLPSGCTNGVNYDTSTHTWSCASTTVPLSHIAAQAADTVLGNFTGSSAAPGATAMPTGCTVGVNYSTSSHTWSCLSATPTTCGVNGCYRTFPDGTQEEWGTLFCGSVSCTVTFPLAFGSTTNLAFNVTAADGTQGNLVTVTSALSTSSVVVTTGAVVYVGGTGTGYTGGATYSWRAIQHN